MKPANGQHDLALCVGHFHVLRHADLAALQRALEGAPRCLLLIGSAHLPRSPRNPFTWEERAEVIRQALPPSQRERLDIEPLREWYDEARTAREIVHAAARHLPRQQGRVLLVRSGSALPFEPPVDWTVLDLGDQGQREEAELRDLLLATRDLDTAFDSVAAEVPQATQDLLRAWFHNPDYPRLCAEWHQIAGEKQAWSVAPYPVVLVTVDAVVRAGRHVLLIRRGRSPGKGLRALPGGFLDPRETVLEGAMRELVEETQLAVPAAELRSALRGVRVFDHPRRSQRGRVITHAHYFDLGERRPPEVLGSDDAATAEWVAVERLPDMEPQFLDDHFLVLDHFLGLGRRMGWR